MDTIKITIPVSPNEITLETMMRVMSIPTDLSELDTMRQMMKIVCGVSGEHFDRMTRADIIEIMSDIDDVMSKSMKMLYPENRIPLTQRIQINGIEYGFHPNIANMTTGEFIDADTFIQRPEKWIEFASVFYRPIVAKTRDTYNIAIYDGNVDENLAKLPMHVFCGLYGFFLTIGEQFANNIRKYLSNPNPTNLMHNYRKNGVGISQFADWQIMMSNNWKTLQKQIIERHCFFLLLMRTNNVFKN